MGGIIPLDREGTGFLKIFRNQIVESERKSGFSPPNVPPAKTSGQLSSQSKLLLQSQQVSRILGQNQALNSPSLLGG